MTQEDKIIGPPPQMVSEHRIKRNITDITGTKNDNTTIENKHRKIIEHRDKITVENYHKKEAKLLNTPLEYGDELSYDDPRYQKIMTQINRQEKLQKLRKELNKLYNNYEPTKIDVISYIEYKYIKTLRKQKYDI